MRFLTRSYVDWLGLELVPLTFRRNRGYVSMGLGGTLEAASDHDGWQSGVVHEGTTYVRESDGLAFERVSDWLARKMSPSYPADLRERYAQQGIVLP